MDKSRDFYENNTWLQIFFVIIWDSLQSIISGDNALNDLAAIFTIGIIIIAPLTFLIKRWFNRRAERADVSKSLHGELKDALDALDGTSKRQVMEIEIGGIKKYYTLAFMNYDMYDSLIFSGRIQSINHNLQQKIQDIFRRVKGHKEYLKLTMQLRDTAAINDKDITNITDPYYCLIADYESELEEMIPPVMEELEKNF